MMSPDEMERKKKLLDENCNQLASIMDEYKNGSKEFALLYQIMGPMVDQMIELKDDLFSEWDLPSSSNRKESADGADNTKNT